MPAPANNLKKKKNSDKLARALKANLKRRKQAKKHKGQ